MENMKQQLPTENSTFQSSDACEYALDTSGHRSLTQCPNCDKEAETRTFDECLGGSINQVYSTNCPHCSYHECDREFCSLCEAKAEIESERNSDLMDSIQKADLILDSLTEQLGKNSYINAKDITTLKIILFTNPEVSDYFSIIFVPVGVSTLHYIQRKLLDAKFTRNLNLKIEQAKSTMR